MTERIITDSNGRKHITTEPLLHTPAQQEPVSCPVCNQVHTILDADESQIIRNAKDGYPDGRTPRLLTLQERVAALCQYASDWKRWCLEKENTTPQAQPAQQEPVAWIDPKHLEWLAQSPDNLTGAGLAARQRSADMVPLYTSPPAQRTWVNATAWRGLTDEEIKALASWWPSYDQMPALMVLAKDIQNSLKEKNT